MEENRAGFRALPGTVLRSNRRDVNNLFLHPYTKIDFLKDDLGVTSLTATRYLEALVADGTLEKRKIGRSNYYINRGLFAILTGAAMTEPGP